ncbi:MAG: hypothetical protein MUE41_14455, partial [Gemmatimonadaceae bacterium]|nr:hypothetical protein [Gemmatimonadaceae bacterium]
MRAPTLLLVTDTYRPERNGAAIVSARAVRGLVQRGWRVHVIAPTPATSVDDAGDGARVTRVPSVGLPFYGSVRVALAGDR